MDENAQETRRAISGRDGARTRVRRLTGGVVIASIALAGTIAGYVARGATGAKTVSTTAAAPTKKKTQTTVAVPATPAAPSLLAPGESAPAPAQSQSVAPSVTQSPPVAVSGGS